MKHKHANNVIQPIFNISITIIIMNKFKNVVLWDIIIHHNKHVHVIILLN